MLLWHSKLIYYFCMFFCACVFKGVYCQPTGQCWWHVVMSWRPCSVESMQRPGAEWCPSTVSPQTPSCLSWSTSTLTPAVLVSSLHAGQMCTHVHHFDHCCTWRLTAQWTTANTANSFPKGGQNIVKEMALPSSLFCGLIKPCSRFCTGKPHSQCVIHSPW